MGHLYAVGLGGWHEGYAGAAAFTCSVKVFQVAGAKASWGPSGWLLSRIATAGPNDPTSTQVPPLSPL
jgi:hypothetical protein